MPSHSKAQQRFFGMVHAYQKGKLNTPVSDRIKDVAGNIGPVAATHFAQTKHKGLPNHVKKAYANGFMKAAEAYGLDTPVAIELYKKSSAGWAPAMMGAVPGALVGGYMGGQQAETEEDKRKKMLLGALAGGGGGALLGNAVGSLGYQDGVGDTAAFQRLLLNSF